MEVRSNIKRGADVRIVYSPTDAIKLAKKNPDKHVMFLRLALKQRCRPPL
jgi:hydrogenase expression/formation protein HypD